MSIHGGIYIHIPFCRSKCSYCDFPSFEGREELMESYTASLVKEIAASESIAPDTVYFGGGTPSYLPTGMVERIFRALHDRFDLGGAKEITFEMNPFTGESGRLADLARFGVNRISIGAQSFSPRKLKAIGRQGNPGEAESTYRLAREAGFDNVSLDVIYGVPGEDPGELATDLQKCLELDPEHLSAYQLTYTKGTALYDMASKGEVTPLDNDVEADMFRQTVDTLSERYTHYEISNFAKEGKNCAHNVGYWLGRDYLGFGAGAHSWFMGKRYENPPTPERYIKDTADGEIRRKIVEETAKERFFSYLLMRFRLLDREIVYQELDTALGGNFLEKYNGLLQHMEKQGDIRIGEGGIRLTWQGIIFLDKILLQFMEVI